MPAAKDLTAEAHAHLEVIDMEKLLHGDSDTAEVLLHAAENPGFFYVDLSGPGSKSIVSDIETSFTISHDYFAQPQDAKEAHFRNGVDRGYKSGKGYESFEIATAELHDTTLAYPGFIGSHETVLKRFAEQSDVITKALLRSLLASIGKAELESKLTANPGDSGLKLITAPTNERRQDAPDTTHTDGGLLTLLWCPLLSSQIQNPRTKEWLWVEPKEGCAIVNVADALQRHTGDQLHSCIHRVLQLGDGAEERHFLSYYLRPSTA